jgi:hypothetical protein
MDNPRRVERNTIVSHSLDFLEDIQPKARNGKSTYVRTNTQRIILDLPERMKFAAPENDTLAVNEERMLVPRYLKLLSDTWKYERIN